tara:strand:+ start:8649 stop:9641 length:993 start_codon:yes stop_codon:yes gene_type:complete
VPKKLKIGGVEVKPGEKKTINLEVAKIYDSTELTMPVRVIRGTKDGPIVFLSAAIHGDELNGVEIIREVLKYLESKKIKGTIIAVPIVNVFGFNNKSRYLPDRRDLNRSFPGSTHGSLASRMAKIFLKEVVSKCTHGIDFHTGAIHRSNFPQIRADLSCSKTRKFAKSFNAPMTLDSKTRDGSLREAARKKGVLTLVYEGGQALRFEDSVIKMGKKGCLAALREIGVLLPLKRKVIPSTVKAYGSYWIRSPKGGTFKLEVSLGQAVKKNQVIGVINDPLGEEVEEILVHNNGYIIGVNELPLVTQGEALVHVATVKGSTSKKDRLMDFVD